MGAETGARGDAVLVDDPQRPIAHMGRIVVAGEGEAVERLEPAVVGKAPVLGSADGDHAELLVVLRPCSDCVN
jgi:hypothetical protein